MNTTPSSTPTASATSDDAEPNTADAASSEAAAVPASRDPLAKETTDEERLDPAAENLEDAEDEDLEAEEELEADALARTSHGVGTGAAAVVSAALGVVALTGAWSGRIAAERETLLGQIKTSGGGSAAQQISEIYGDAWHTTALVNGLFAVLALLVGVFVLVRPAFGAPSDRARPTWIRAVALAGVALGVLGVLISAGMYFDLFLSLPTAPAPAAG
ncbi:hypothetical protein EES43_21240 [Streptomyces sp. ADI96-02]|uniref:hypothetical protein n=1 Tax=Streptomyces sp. ADI96-02 TaxID=1522760 RepID=UPI000F551D33|nr:hypothetical protein [Streptomyces sp. ADI96-02]RPK57688.1 hypothetical protein EES43_21240 [Streptomyces sp. ADI96-02]